MTCCPRSCKIFVPGGDVLCSCSLRNQKYFQTISGPNVFPCSHWIKTQRGFTSFHISALRKAASGVCSSVNLLSGLILVSVFSLKRQKHFLNLWIEWNVPLDSLRDWMWIKDKYDSLHLVFHQIHSRWNYGVWTSVIKINQLCLYEILLSDAWEYSLFWFFLI